MAKQPTNPAPRPTVKAQQSTQAPPTHGSKRPEDVFTITSTNDPTRTRYSTLLYKGPPLTGKTHCLGTWHLAGPILYLLFDPKSATIEEFPDVHIIAPKDTFQFYQQVYPRILNGTLTDSQGKPLDYATIALDSLSFLARDIELEIMGTGDEMPNGGWNIFATRISRTLSYLGSMARSPNVPHPANFLVTIHEQEKQKRVRDASGQPQFVSDGLLPKISGQVRTILEGYFDLTLLTFKEERALPAVQGKPRDTAIHYGCRTIGREKNQQAGGSFRGLRKLPSIIDGTYPGLCKLAGIDPATGKQLEPTQEESK